MLKPSPHKERIPPISRALLGRLFKFIQKSRSRSYRGSSCWEWMGSINSRTGYGQFSVRRSTYLAHRFTYHLFVGPIAEGLVCDHLCRNRQCVNPAHIETILQIENNRRGVWTKRPGPALKTHCLNGHPFEGPNAGTQKSYQNNGSRTGPLTRRVCRRCRADRQLRYTAKQKVHNTTINC